MRKFPLHNILAEEILIGVLLSYAPLKREASQSLNRYFFSLKKHQLLYDCIININKKHKTFHLIKIIRQLWETELLTEIGGIEQLASNIQKSQSLSLSHSTFNHLKYCLNILYYYYTKRLFVQFSNSIIQINYFYHLSINQIYKQSIRYLNKISNIRSIHNLELIDGKVDDLLHKINDQLKQNKDISSGFRDLDLITHGFKSGDLIIIAGRPSMGKTSLAINILNHLSLNLQKQVCMFSLEMSKNEILNKLIALISNINVNKIKKRLVNKEEWQIVQKACYKLMSTQLSIDDNGYSSLNYIKSRCKNYNLSESIIIIDYLQLIKIEDKSTENRSQELGNITRELKLLTQSLKSIIIVLSQLNRNIENRANKRPLLSDLRESGCIDGLSIPQIQKSKSGTTIKIVHCFKQYYILNRLNKLIIYETLPQHIFGIINTKRKILYITHNHQILTYKRWKKEDQIKKHQFNNLQYNNIINSKLVIEINRLILIRRLNKNKVYDVALQKYHNFIINNYIVHNSIEQDADLILMLYKNNEHTDNRIIDIVVAKHRHGPIGSFQLLFHADVCKFSNMQNQSISKQLLIQRSYSNIIE